MAFRHHHELAIEALGFEPVRKPREYHRNVALRRQLGSFVKQLFGRIARCSIVALGVPHVDARIKKRAPWIV